MTEDQFRNELARLIDALHDVKRNAAISPPETVRKLVQVGTELLGCVDDELRILHAEIALSDDHIKTAQIQVLELQSSQEHPERLGQATVLRDELLQQHTAIKERLASRLHDRARLAQALSAFREAAGPTDC
ncbi:MAG: hypothetical protein AB7R00_03895 [Kofleriaceae bacterium]